MTKPSAKANLNTFVKGFITEASPLNFPADATLDEQNFEIDTKGLRERRLGLDYEPFYSLVSSAETVIHSCSSFRWDNVPGFEDSGVTVAQINNKLFFFDPRAASISRDGYLGFVTIPVVQTSRFHVNNCDNYLIITTGTADIFTVEYINGLFSVSSGRLKTRDLWGVEDRYTQEQVFSQTIKRLGFDNSGETLTFTAPNIITSTASLAPFSSLDAGDFFTVVGSGSNNRTFTFSSYDGINNIVYTTGNVTDEEVGVLGEVFTVGFSVTFRGYTVTSSEFDLTQGSGLSFRPVGKTNNHIYNLRNQGWSIPRRIGSQTTDPITAFYNSKGQYPSNSDQIWYGAYNDPSSPEVEKFSISRAADSVEGSIEAPRGFFVIDVLERGKSRLEELTLLKKSYPILSTLVASLPSDRTNGGAAVSAEFAGKVFFGGFNSEVVDGDSKSPRLNSYLVFSQTVKNKGDIFNCYQSGDPTSRESSDIVDTDGGFVRISGMNRCINMFAMGKNLIVIADNGVWSLEGGSDYGFTATNYRVEKLSNVGSLSKSSIVVANNVVFYWGEDGIYLIQRDQYGDLKVENVSISTINSFYSDIPVLQRIKSVGAFDSYSNKIRWLFNMQDKEDNSFEYELILDLNFNAFTKNRFYRPEGLSSSLYGFIQTDPVTRDFSLDEVLTESDPVFVGFDPVIVSSTVNRSGNYSFRYLTLVQDTDQFKITFSSLNNSDFRDWKSFDSVGVDAYAYFITGAMTVQEPSAAKQVPYLTAYLRRTETGMELEGGQLVPANRSSCLVRSQWDWANSANSNKWSPVFQVYRQRQMYIPQNVADPYDTGFELVVTKSKLRGRGRSFSMFVETEPYRDCSIYGWTLEINGNPK